MSKKSFIQFQIFHKKNLASKLEHKSTDFLKEFYLEFEAVAQGIRRCSVMDHELTSSTFSLIRDFRLAIHQELENRGETLFLNKQHIKSFPDELEEFEWDYETLTKQKIDEMHSVLDDESD